MGAYNFIRFEEEAREVLTKAQGKARELVQAALSEAARIREQARKEGYDKGHQDGYQKGLEAGMQALGVEARPVMKFVETIAQNLDAARGDIVRKAETEVLKLAIEIARKIIRAEITTQGKIVQENLKRAIELVAKRHELTVHVNPNDYKTVKKFFPKLFAGFPEIGNIELRKDDAVSPGGCVVKTREGGVDADIHTQLEQIEKALLGS